MTDPSHARIDWPRLITTLDIAQELHGGLSDRDVAERVGIAPSGICRLRRGQALSADGLAKLIAWLYPASRPTWITVEPPKGERGNA
jgi:transcriptional regulator with XRE-family HTH domain